MWDSPFYLEYAARERTRELASEAQRLSLETSVQPPGPRGLRRRLISLGFHLDHRASGPASPTSRPHMAPHEPKTGGARNRARLDVHQWRKGVMRLALAIGLARYFPR
jgi:hypothetical protein